MKFLVLKGYGRGEVYVRPRAVLAIYPAPHCGDEASILLFSGGCVQVEGSPAKVAGTVLKSADSDD